MTSQTHPKKRGAWRLSALLRRPECWCIAVGAALCSVYALARMDSATGSADAIGQFVQGLPPPDQSAWSPSRVRDYAASQEQPGERPVAVLSVPSLKLQVPVFPHDDELSLNRGAALITGMAQPDRGGNLGLAGHRDGFFRALQGIKVGAVIEVRTRLAQHRYRVTAIDIVDRSDNRLLADSELPTVTLVTCYPFYFVGNAPQRFVVTGQYLWAGET